MRKSMFVSLMIVGAAVVFAIPAVTTGQFQMGGKGGKGGGKGGAGGGLSMDPGAIFDNYLAKGRNFFLISEAPRSRDLLTQFASEKGITNGQITRQQYMDFQEWQKAKLLAPSQGSGATTPPVGGKGGKGGFGGGNFDPSQFGGGAGGFPGGGKGPKGGGGLPPSVALNPEAVNDFADREFKRYDVNSDMRLNKDELPPQLLAVFSMWDKNGDTFIDQAEYRDYYAARIREGGSLDRAVATIIIEEDELEKKAVVYKVGNLPRNIPSWFKELDQDNDGQIAMYEWRAGKKPLDEFRTWDLNDDGFIIPEECMRNQEILAKNNPRGGGDGASFGGFSGFGGGTGERPMGFGGGKGKGENGGFGGFGGFGGGTGERPMGFGGKGKKGGDSGDTENPFPFGGGGKKGKKGGGN